MFWENVKRRITAVAIQLTHAEEDGKSNLAKSAYYGSATMLVSTIVEGLVYHLAKKHTTNNGNIVDNLIELKKIHQIPTGILGRNDICLCKSSVKDINIDDDGVTFQRLNRFLRKNTIISEKELRALDYVRKERNKLHLQGLDVQDIGYTKSKFNRVAKPVDFLTRKINTP